MMDNRYIVHIAVPTDILNMPEKSHLLFFHGTSHNKIICLKKKKIFKQMFQVYWKA